MIRLKNILYHVCCNNRERLPGKDDDEDYAADDDDTGDMSISDIAATDDKVAEILTNTYHKCNTSYVHRYTIFYENNLAQ